MGAFGNYPNSSARMLSEQLQGVRLGNASQEAKSVSSENDLYFERRCEDHGGPFSRVPSSPGTGLYPLKQELPVWKAMWDSRPSWLRILDLCPGRGDRTILETVINVATSMPFIAIGLQAPRTKPAARVYANSLVGVGVASTLYHVSRGESRKFFRYGDYAMIAVASLCLNSAIKDDRPRALMLASALLLPIQPTLITLLHTGMMEAAFLQKAANEPKFRRAHGLHKLSSVVGAALFVADDVFTQTPYIHAAWHLTAALGIATCTKLLEIWYWHDSLIMLEYSSLVPIISARLSVMQSMSDTDVSFS